MTYVVYPDTDGAPLPSLREKQMLAATLDYRALRLLEGLVGREETLALCENILGEKISVTAVPKDGDTLLTLREAVNKRIEHALQK